MSSALDSDDEPTSLLPELVRLVEETKDATNNQENAKFSKLGQKYLSAIVTEILLFRQKIPVKDVDTIIDADISALIDSKYFKGESLHKIDIAVGRIFHQRDMKRLKGIEEDIMKFFELQFPSENEDSYSNFLFEVSISSIGKKVRNLIDDSSQFLHPFSEINSFSTNDKSFEKMGAVKDMQAHVKEVQDYLEKINVPSLFNSIMLNGRKTVKIVKVEHKQSGGITLYSNKVELVFENLLDNHKKEQLTATATEEATSKKGAKDKAIKQMLKNIFITYPQIFEDCKEFKGK